MHVASPGTHVPQLYIRGSYLRSHCYSTNLKGRTNFIVQNIPLYSVVGNELILSSTWSGLVQRWRSRFILDRCSVQIPTGTPATDWGFCCFLHYLQEKSEMVLDHENILPDHSKSIIRPWPYYLMPHILDIEKVVKKEVNKFLFMWNLTIHIRPLK
jgi:hypothetical protein